MIIHAPETIRDGGSATIRALVAHKDRKGYLWFSVGREHEEWLTPETADAFVVAMLLSAMMNKEDIHVDGVMSEKLFYNLTKHYMRIIASSFPSLSPVGIIPEGLTSTIYNLGSGGVATGFSGGIDSFCVLADHLFGPVPAGFKVTHLLFNNVGSHGVGGRRLFGERYNRILPLVRELGLPIIVTDSNLDELLSLDFLTSHMPRNLAVPLLFQKLIRRFYYASAYRYEDCFVGPTDSMGYSDPMAVHLLSTESTECISSGCQYSRVEKTMRVAEIRASYKYLDVCVSPEAAGNCSVCWKCARTILTLEILGRLGDYKAVFDLDKYRQIRSRYVTEVLSSSDPLQKEIVELAKERGYELSSPPA
jgi:hypothetical protein